MNWISVKDRLPEICEDVFVVLNDEEFYRVGKYKGFDKWDIEFWAYDDDEIHEYKTEEIDYWFKLPDIPK